MLQYDPLLPLLAAENESLRFFATRDLLGGQAGPVTVLWDLPVPARLFRRQRANGAWAYPNPSGRIRRREDYDQIETYRALRVLMEQYGLDRRHRGIRRAARFVFGCQTPDGDIRGIYGTQLSPTYTAGLLELLVKAGFGNTPAARRAYRWLLSVRQDDGGWAIPMRTVGKTYTPQTLADAPILPNRHRPSSHLVTGMVLRALAAHPRYRTSRAAHAAAGLLADRLFQPDRYPDRRAASYWTAFTYPFWFTDLISALDSLSRVGVSVDHPNVARGLEWLRTRQRRSGTWRLRVLLRKASEPDADLWISLAICRVFKRFATGPTL